MTRIIVLALLLVPLLACSDGSTAPEPDPITITTDVDAYVIPTGLTTRFTASVNNTTNRAVIWRSDAPDIATVTAVGPLGLDADITGVRSGVVTVRAISVQDTTRQAHIEITVIPGPGDFIELSPGSADLGIGNVVTIQAAYKGMPAPVTWRTTAPAVASVNVEGRVTALATGEAAIVALLAADTTIRGTAFVRVGASAPHSMPVLGLGSVTERYTGEVAARGDWAYTSTWGNRQAPGNVVKVWNVADDVPVLVDSLRIPAASTTGDVQISDDGELLVVAVEHNPNGAIMIYDRSNPAKPDSIRRFSNANTRQGVHTVKLGRVAGRHYAFLSVNPGTNPARLVIVDITNPSSPSEVWSQTMGAPFVHDVFVRDGLLFAALWHDGLRIFDIGGAGRGGSPSNPVVVGNIKTLSGSIHNIWWFHDPTTSSKRYVFLGEEAPASVLTNAAGDLHVIDVTDMSNPVQVAQYGVAGAGAHNFWMDEPSGILYAAFYNGGVRALDVRGDLGDCTASQRNGRGFCDLRQMGREKGVAVPAGAYIWGVVFQDAHVYASDMLAGLYKFDASALVR